MTVTKRRTSQKTYDAKLLGSDDCPSGLFWEIESEILGRALATLPAPSAMCSLDFACGTGRVLSVVQARTSMKCTGVDVSALHAVAGQRALPWS